MQLTATSISSTVDSFVFNRKSKSKKLCEAPTFKCTLHDFAGERLIVAIERFNIRGVQGTIT
jgi:hypothetical protein